MRNTAIVLLTVSSMSGVNPVLATSNDGISCAFRQCKSSGNGWKNFGLCYRSLITARAYGEPDRFPSSLHCDAVPRAATQLSCRHQLSRTDACGATQQPRNCEMWCVEEPPPIFPAKPSTRRPGCVGTFPTLSATAQRSPLTAFDVGRLVAVLADATCTVGGNCTLRCASLAVHGGFGACAVFNTSLLEVAFGDPWVVLAGGATPPRDVNDPPKGGIRFSELQVRPSVFWGAATVASLKESTFGLMSLVDSPPLTGGFPRREGLTVECTEQNSCKGLNVVCPRYSTCEVNCGNRSPGDGVCGTKDEPLIIFAYADSPVSVNCNAAVPQSDNTCFFVLQDAEKLYMVSSKENALSASHIARAQLNIITSYVARYPPLSRPLFPPPYGALSFQNRTCMWTLEAFPRGAGVRPNAARWSCGDASDACVPDPAQVSVIIYRYIHASPSCSYFELAPDIFIF